MSPLLSTVNHSHQAEMQFTLVMIAGLKFVLT